ncbi:flagellar biosynthesis protein FlhB [Rheinheimera muenzenbergensis]|uniref:Flagellar biosynthetic protein FlhB n=1 Tax=Rheinheimera muenzenbergensis TaxID=1193628 RepID=A0ABU8C441_9GAMM|nr:flagellar biosynthesis protein FlhB [Gammaproteobacteria bacterium]MBU1553336.1 flagellar biosynthesis protein FlhB [Gammaproteobacteria bacterium]MBU2070780.1 flagellar biosynthesis protein FlhB [Gammaproteobacteria bacterium]MBU2182771.1 flagellar biosynthesis protein FlhB [Gammaproteobacteria bacterium]MBU2205987.1 flagellar biosynthesis protein FlhB [Gammaproteobacteria bacterium]
MAEQNTSQERTEQPTEKRLRKARKDGQVARSKELNTAVLLMLGVAGLLWFAQLLFSLFMQLMQSSLQLNRDMLANNKLMPLAIGQALLDMLSAMLPFLLLLFIGMWIIGAMPGGFIFSGSLLGPKFSQLNPLAGLKRMFSANALVELLKSVLKVLLLGGCLYGFLSQLWTRLLFLQRLDLQQAMQEGIALLALSLMITVTLLLLVAAVDVPYQQYKVSSKVKMTRQEVKEERKSSDGSPEIKGRIRQIQFQLANRRIEDRVPKADVIVMNPTHYAVAIRYSEKDAKAPYVVAKGIDEMALRIKAVAQRHEVEVLEVPVLARAIYYSTRVDQEVPKGLYTAVAYVLTYVMQLKAWKNGRGRQPAALPALEIPKNLLDKANVRGS